MRSPDEWQPSANTTQSSVVTFLQQSSDIRQVNERRDVNVQIWSAAADDETNFLENVDRFPTGETREAATKFRRDVRFVFGLQFRSTFD
jgi:hypothetical protein